MPEEKKSFIKDPPSERPRAGSKRRADIKLQRIEGLLRPVSAAGKATGESIPIRLILDHLPRGRLGLHLAASLKPGTSVEISLVPDSPISFRGQVLSCQPEAKSMRVLKSSTPGYRAEVQLKFATAEEVNQLKRVCEELARAA